MSAMTVEARIEDMRAHGSSLTMNWGEDPTPTWEVAWITGGKRFCAFHSDLAQALTNAHVDGMNHFSRDRV